MRVGGSHGHGKSPLSVVWVLRLRSRQTVGPAGILIFCEGSMTDATLAIWRKCNSGTAVAGRSDEGELMASKQSAAKTRSDRAERSHPGEPQIQREPKPPFPEQHQESPGLESKLRP